MLILIDVNSIFDDSKNYNYAGKNGIKYLKKIGEIAEIILTK